MDQTSIAVTFGLLCAPAGGIVTKKLTGWSGWVALPIGAISSFLMITVSTYLLVGLIGKALPTQEGDAAQALQNNHKDGAGE